MIPDVLIRIVATLVFVIGGVVCCLGLLLVGEWCIWHVRERMGKYMRLHAYIKAHKEEFVKWNKKYNKERHG